MTFAYQNYWRCVDDGEVPTKNGLYLCGTPYDDEPHILEFKNGTFYNLFNRKIKVTYWTPLPKIPKKGGKR